MFLAVVIFEKSEIHNVMFNVSDNSGKFVTKGVCEKYSWGVCGSEQVRSINERIEKESKSLKCRTIWNGSIGSEGPIPSGRY
jgi:hypothetical protein